MWWTKAEEERRPEGKVVVSRPAKAVPASKYLEKGAEGVSCALLLREVVTNSVETKG